MKLISSSESPAFSSIFKHKKVYCLFMPKLDLVDEACGVGWSADIKWPVFFYKKKLDVFFSKLYPDHDPESFKGSTGWLTRFNLCHGIKNVQLRGEILSSDMEAVEPFIYLLKQVIESEGYSRDQILIADETGLWWQMTPSCSLNTSGIAMAAIFFF